MKAIAWQALSKSRHKTKKAEGKKNQKLDIGNTRKKIIYKR